MVWASAALLALVLAILAHAGLSRIPGVPGSMVVKFVGPGLICGAVLAGWLVLAARAAPIESLAGVLAYAGACELYLFLFTLVSSSVSSQLILRLSSTPTPMTRSAAFAREDDMVVDRLTKLLANDLLVEMPGGYGLTARGRRLLRTFDRLRYVFRHEVPESSVERTAPHPTHPR
jgi:hypothetical protein